RGCGGGAGTARRAAGRFDRQTDRALDSSGDRERAAAGCGERAAGEAECGEDGDGEDDLLHFSTLSLIQLIDAVHWMSGRAAEKYRDRETSPRSTTSTGMT